MTEERGALAKIAKAIASVHPAGCTDDEAGAIVGAIAEAGYAVVPVEPSEAMEEAALDVPFIAMGNGEYLEPDRIDIYRAMLSASPITTKGTNE